MSADDGPVTLSTGHEVTLPLRAEARVAGAAFAASRSAVAGRLPPGLSPVRVAPGRAAVLLLAVDYRRVGVPGLDSYDEFGVVLPATLSSAPGRGLGGYVDALPVTTEPARALGVEVWGYPKSVAEIDVEHGRRTRATVRVDGERVVTLVVRRPRTITTGVRARSYTTRDGRLLAERVRLFGSVGAWPLSRAAAVDVGDGPRVADLRALDLGERSLLRLAGDGAVTVGRGVAVDGVGANGQR
ncbi:MAG: acetoacetate decarboxylase family protein [Haloferacaceae archaeon]